MSSEVSLEEMKLQKTEHAQESIESEHITDEQVKTVIHHGETTGEKIFQKEDGRSLAKKRIGEATVCVEYSPMNEENAFEIHAVYSYKATLKV